MIFCAHDWIRTSTSIGHHPLKMACLPISPREHLRTKETKICSKRVQTKKVKCKT
nr:hypothetical protein [uncultured bacterium]